MKRRNFIKAFAAACVVPVVAAKAIASHRKRPTNAEIDAILHGMWDESKSIQSILDYKPTVAYSLRNLRGGVMCEDDVFIAHYDQSGNGNHLFKKDKLN